VGSAFSHEGDAIVLLEGAQLSEQNAAGPPGESVTGRPTPRKPGPAWESEFASSEYAKTIYGLVGGSPPAIDLAAQKSLIGCLVALVSEKAIRSAHDVSDGGLAVTLAECCFKSKVLSADCRLDDRTLSPDFSPHKLQAVSASEARPAEVALFGEGGARAVVSISPRSLARLQAIAAKWNVRAQPIGTVTRANFRIQYNGTSVIQGSPESFRQIWSESLRKAVEGE